jgi:hypothetical protein
MSINKQLKTFSKTLFGSVPFGERAHNLRLLDDETWIGAFNLKIFSNKFVDESCSAARIRALNTLFLAQIVEEYSCFFSM